MSCEKNNGDAQDLEKPKISSILINGLDANSISETQLFLDSNNLIQLTFTDNIALSQNSINIHFANDVHEHTARILAEEVPFSYGPVIKNLSGTKQSLFLEIPLGNSYKLGDYHLEILITDEAANSEAYVYTLELSAN